MSSLPQLEWDEYHWTGSLILPAWKGFQARLGAYGGESSTDASDGTVFLEVKTLGEQEVLLSQEQMAAFDYLVEHQEGIRDAIIAAVFDLYPQWQEQYGYDEEEMKQFMPTIEQPSQLASLMGPSTVRVFTTAKNGLAYIGWEFSCTWDDEHGLGFITHATRVVEVGGADTGILQWIAEKDVGANS